MPQPFEQFQMHSLQAFTKPQFREEAKKINANEKIGDLAHFLVHNFRGELDSSEHVIDTAIRLLKKLHSDPNVQGSDTTDAE
jgi:hypothetical protein